MYFLRRSLKLDIEKMTLHYFAYLIALCDDSVDVLLDT